MCADVAAALTTDFMLHLHGTSHRRVLLLLLLLMLVLLLL